MADRIVLQGDSLAMDNDPEMLLKLRWLLRDEQRVGSTPSGTLLLAWDAERRNEEILLCDSSCVGNVTPGSGDRTRSTCVAHDAVDKPDRESRGTASSGIGTVDYVRHNMKRPNGVGDLQQGEKYLNMDYLFFMGLLGTLLLRFVVSYDIACQWYKNLWGRMAIFPAEAQLSGEKKFVFLVPKIHLPAHIEECNINFSFNLTPSVGRTDGEAPERGWADANRLANSTSISGPGARRDTLDAHFQYSNWKKITKLDKIQKCVPMMLETRAAWVDVEASFEPSVIEAWTAMAIAWEADGKHPNPFASTVQHEGIAEVRRRLAAIAAADVGHEGVRGDMHETEMLSMGLQLEQQQYIKRPNVWRRETKLRRKIDSWSAIQQLFIPEVTVLRDREDAERKRDMSLWLPSAIGTRAQCPLRLQEYEFQLRQGQAVWALKVMRDGLILRAHEYIYRDGVHGTKAKLRSGSRTDAIQLRIDCAAEEYRAAPTSAATACGGRAGPSAHDVGDPERQRGGGKKKKAQSSAMGPEDARAAEIQAEAKKGMSWVWYSEGRTGKPEEVVKSERREQMAIRYAEEIDLVEEEMRRVLHFLRWRRDWWHARAELRVQVDRASQEGQGAYARKQAGYMQGLRERFKQLWRYVPQELRMAREEYAAMTPDKDETVDGVQEQQAGQDETVDGVQDQQPGMSTSATHPQTQLEEELVHE
ncbi:hypothetical protein B0H14DRAFT_3457041 [Mycena olivaceomarginata]|nr:hypothetical protein B0H14DRAFT_3457041 [Mycena olivaceomarginata]